MSMQQNESKMSLEDRIRLEIDRLAAHNYNFDEEPAFLFFVHRGIEVKLKMEGQLSK